MKKYLPALLIVMLTAVFAKAQNQQFSKSLGSTSGGATQPFLFSVNTLTADAPAWNFNYTGSYGEHTARPFGFDGVDQQFAVKGYLGNRFTLFANADLGFAHNGSTTTAQQAEVIRDFVGGKTFSGARFGLGLGVNRDFSNTGAIFSRVTASFEAASWRVGGNMRFEKAFSKTRDGIDLVSSIGFQHHITGPVFAGIEAVGEDLEGFWEADETEGGAKLLVGPSIHVAPTNSKFSFSVSGGPVFHATHSTVLPSEAIRDVGTLGTQNGYTIRAMVAFNLH